MGNISLTTSTIRTDQNEVSFFNVILSTIIAHCEAYMYISVMDPTLVDTEDIDILITETEKLIDRRSPEAQPLTEKIMELAIADGSLRHLAQAKYILAFYSCLVANDYDKAIALCEEILETLNEKEIRDILYKIYMTLGNAYHLKGEVFSAEQSYMKGLKLLQNQPELTPRQKRLLASFYYNLSLLLSSSQISISAEEYLEKAIELYQEVGDDFRLSKGYVAYATVLSRKREYHKAIDMMHKALEIDIRLNDPYSIALSKANLGIYHMSLNDYDRSMQYIAEALDFFVSNNRTYETAMVKKSLAKVYSETDQKEKALSLLLEAEVLFKELDNKQEITQVYEWLADIYEEKGDLTALKYYRKYVDSLRYFFDAEKTNALTRAKKEFETEQKEKEAEILRQKNEEVKRYVIKLEQSNDQLNQFAGVASHDLREPLRMIASYTGLLKRTMKEQMTAEQEEFMHYIVDGATRMDRMIHDLLRLAKVDANPHLQDVKLDNVVQEIRLNSEVLIKEKNAQIRADALPIITADRTMMLQLMQNIIGNGIKYNESATPTMDIKSKKKNDRLEITIADNGIGIPDHLREKAFQIFNRLPTQGEYPGSGIGLAICKKIVDSMDGTISIADNPGGGTVFTISLPERVVIG
ncbi:MAG: hypothetical protein JWO03_438 [Bacteroidetes bacterium]|nr:hypothetical protein [Bacteroidota bacterium]